MNIIFVGRLDTEKWIQTIMNIILQKSLDIKNQSWNSICFHIVGKGSHSRQIESLSKEFPQLIKYYGRKNKKDILWLRSHMDYFLMPSLFLETFGLTACESLLLGVPVIGHKKWWLVPFVHEELIIDKQTGNNDVDKIMNLLDLLQAKEKWFFNDFVNNIQKNYSIQQRHKTIVSLFRKQKNILMVSDFVNYSGGGVETHIHDACAIIKSHGYKTLICGHQAPENKRARYKKLFLMSLSIANIRDSRQIKKIIKKESIWLVRRHSISRVIWRLPLFLAKSQISNSIITHHELWLFHPYPSKVTSINQIPKARSLWDFVKAGQTNNPIKKLAILGKYFLVYCIHKQLDKSNFIHIIPSERMKDMVKSWHPHQQIVVIPHFVKI